MRALPFSLLLLVASAAHADWRALAVTGTPTDVEVWQPGLFSVSTTSQAVLVSNGAVVQTVMGESVGTLLTPGGCLLSLQRSGALVSSTACAFPGDTPFGTSGNNAVSYARTAAGAAYAYGEPAQLFVYSPAAADAGTWTALPNTGARKATQVADAVRVAGVDHALFGLVGGAGTELFWFAGPGAPQVVSAPAGVGVVEAELFPQEGSAAAALLATQQGLLRGVLGSSPTPFEPVPLPEGVSAVLGVEVTPDAGSALGDGFGLAVAGLADGGHVLLSAVPATSGAEVARSWRIQTTFPGPSFPAGISVNNLDRVRCVGASFCVVTVRSGSGNNVLVYTNAAAPSLGALAPIALDEGEQLTLPLLATDPDGDAVRLGAALLDGGAPSVGLAVTPDDAGLRLVISAGAVCAPATAELELTASDGLAAHDQRVRQAVTVRNSQPDPQVVLGEVDSSALQLRCGEGAHGRLVQALPAGLCAEVAVSWTQVSGPPLQQPVLAGAAVDVRTVETELDALLGQTLVLQVQADAGSGNADAREQSLLLSTAPFVALQHRLERPLTVEGETVGVFTELHNPTACALQDVRVEEQLEGLDYVPGSARFDGQPVQAVQQEGRLVVTGLPLGAGARGTLSYSVRTRLLGSAGIRGEAFRRSVPISEPVEALPQTGACGCTGAPAGASALALLALLRVVRGLRARS